MKISTRSLARASARHPWRVIAIWGLALMVALTLVVTLLAGGLTTSGTFSNDPESKHGADLLEKRLRGPEKLYESMVVHSGSLKADDPQFRTFVQGLSSQLTSLGPSVVESAVTYYDSGQASLVSKDGSATLIWIALAGNQDQAQKNVGKVLDVVGKAKASGGFEIYTAGTASIGHDFTAASEKDMKSAEMLDLPVALVILVLVFGAVVAAIIPIVLALFAIVAAVGVTALIAQEFQFAFFVTNMILMMGLAVGIDYSLFIISRFREERERGRSVDDAISEAGGTASRAVFFSGTTVVLALTGMLIIPSTIFRSLAAGAILVVVFSVLASLTMLPAVLSLLGDRVNNLRLPFLQRRSAANQTAQEGGFWDRMARTVMRRPVLSIGVAVALLVAASVPVLGMKTGNGGVSSLPDGFQSKQAFLMLENDFTGGRIYTADVVVDGRMNDGTTAAAIERLKSIVSHDSAFGPAEVSANQAGDLGLVSLPLAYDASSKQAMAAVRRLRSDYIPQAFAGVRAKTYVSGAAAVNVDFNDLTDRFMPIVFGFVLGLSFLLLAVVFRSLVVPLKAVLMNLLSVGAAYGMLVLVFEKGVGAKLLGFQRVDMIEAWLPLFLFSVLFGLSMDYHVFLLSRIRERFDQTGDNTEAVAFGLRSTGRLISGAAVIMVAVFAGFAMGDLSMMQQMGFGLAVAVFLDATLVRTVLVPASMKLLGRWNWYLPSLLSWLPRIGIEGSTQEVVYARAGSSTVTER